jgi:hypothetical protein
MSITLSYGYKKPQTGDKGSSWFPDLEHDIQQLNDHTHNGVTSAKIPTTNISPVKYVLSGSWTEDLPNQRWYKELDLIDVNYSDVVIIVKNSVGDQLLLDVKPVTGQEKKCRIYTNDQNLTDAVAHILV